MPSTKSNSLISKPLGQILRLPCKFIKGETDTSPMIISAITNELKQVGRNIMPIIVRQSAEDRYKTVSNAHILMAARQAKLDFVWCIVIDESMEKQLHVEMGKVVQVNLKTSTEKELASFFEFVRSNEKGFGKIQPGIIAKLIAKYRQEYQLKDLIFLTKLKCGLGKAKLPQLKPYIIFK
jgi:hypothetical protein